MDTSSIGFIILYIVFGLLFSLALPVVIIVLIVRAVTHRGQKAAAGSGTGMHTSVTELTPRQLTLGVLLASAFYAGASALYILPTWLMGMEGEGSIFAVRLVGGFAVLAAGLLLLRYRLVSILMMAVGITSILLAAPYIFTNFGSGATLLVVFVVLIALIGLAIYFSSKEHK